MIAIAVSDYVCNFPHKYHITVKYLGSFYLVYTTKCKETEVKMSGNIALLLYE